MRMDGKLIVSVFVFIFIIVLTAGCGGEKPDVGVFMISEHGVASAQADIIEKEFAQKLGELPFTYGLTITPLYVPEKLLVEIAAHTSQIYVIPRRDFEGFVKQGGFVSLDSIADPTEYPEGTAENPDNHEKHLYGLPVHKLAWAQSPLAGLGELYAVVPEFVKNRELSLQLLQKLLEP